MVVPDEVVFSLRVVTMEKELPAAQAKNDQIVKTLWLSPGSIRFRQPRCKRITSTSRKAITDEEVTKKPPVFLGYTVTKRSR